MCSSSPSSWMTRSRPSAPMSTAAGSSSRMLSPMARTVPELPTASSQPRRRNAAWYGSMAWRAATRARCMRFCDSRPSAKNSSLRRTQPDLQALELQRLESFADDDLGAAAADVADQAAPGTCGHGVRDARVDEARFFDAGDDFDGMPERFARALDEGFLAAARGAARWCRPRARCRDACRAGAGRSVRGRPARAPPHPCSAGHRPRVRRRAAPFRAGDRG